MDSHTLTSELSVAPQAAAHDLQALHAAGFKAVICNWPDGEAPVWIDVDPGKLRHSLAIYDGYGSCPLTVERGEIVLAEFTYGGKVAPSFPKWLIDGTRPSALAWYLKECILPPLYWQAMLKGRKWLAQPEMTT